MTAIASSLVRATALQDRHAVDHAGHGPAAGRPSRLWALLEALGYAGAVIDPSGILAHHRFRRVEDLEQREGRR